MAEDEDLYNLSDSDSPPVRRGPFVQRKDRNTIDNFLTNRTGTELLERGSVASGGLRHPTKNLPAGSAPVANMTSTPMQQRVAPLETPASARSDKGQPRLNKSSPQASRATKIRNEQHFQAEVDAKEAERDREDPDYTSSSTTKRKRKSPTHESQPAAKVQRSQQRNLLFKFCTEQDQDKRTKDLSRIRQDWGDVERWMPESIMPRRWVKVEGKRAEKQPMKDPKDWPTDLLDELAYFSSKTANAPERAYQVLREAVTGQGRGGGGPELLVADVKRAIERVLQDKAKTTPPRTPPPEPVADATETSAEQHVDQAADSQHQAAGSRQLLSPLSPRVVGETRIKSEPGFGRTGPSTALDDPSNDVPRVVGAVQWQNARERRRLKNQLEQTEIRRKQTDIQLEQLQLQQKLWTLEDENRTQGSSS